MSYAGLTEEVLDAVDLRLTGVSVEALTYEHLVRLMSLAWLDGRKSGLTAAQDIYSPAWASVDSRG